MAEIFVPELHAGQLKVWTEGSEHQYNVVCCGRRWGKTVMLVTIAISYVTNKFKVPTAKKPIAGK